MAGDLAAVKTISATHALVQRGVDIGIAKAAVETMVEQGVAQVAVPMVEPGDGLADDLRAAGVDPVVVMEAVPA